MWRKVIVCFLLVIIFVAGCSKVDSASKPDPKEQAKEVATEFKEKQYMIDFDKRNLALNKIEASKIIEEKVEPFLTKETLERNANQMNFFETMMCPI